MTGPQESPEDYVGTNGEWSGFDTAYRSGMVWDGRMFPSAPRHSSFYGAQDPLELVPSPFDDENGDEAWHKSAEGTVVYTGEEFVKTLRPPTGVERAHRQEFWDRYEAQRGHSVAAGTQGPGQGHPRPTAGGEQRFPDAPPTHSELAPALLVQHQISAPLPIQTPVSTLRAPAPLSAMALACAPASTLASTPPAASGHGTHNSSDVDGEYEIDDDHFPDVPQDQQNTTNNDPQDKSTESTSPKTSPPRGIDDWDDANLLCLWKQKVIRKKGYEPMLAYFKNQTAESLHEAWTTHKERCKKLGAEWEAAGKPTTGSSDWFEE
ncbi:hypothetical protein E8E12_007458 [Didymella heteroderae]|uniref:Myb-like domain-containing protein n=1 Tax=Didymella heteroderae TaxID=1769908 RepID=A0A9P5C106_9PLEO|nr:hypothetical protein E8E12_007458 [Didymella heteroderae]